MLTRANARLDTGQLQYHHSNNPDCMLDTFQPFLHMLASQHKSQSSVMQLHTLMLTILFELHLPCMDLPNNELGRPNFGYTTGLSSLFFWI